MKVYSINLFKNTQDKQNNKKQTCPIKYDNSFLRQDSFSFEGSGIRVDKGMLRFYEFNFDRFPLTVKKFLDSVTDKLKFTPLEAQRSAFSALKQAQTIEDVKAAFPQEELFNNLKHIKDTKASVGLLGIYREFKDLYEDGILKNGGDLTVYLLAKLFLDAKTLDEINEDLENDLNDDIKNEFKHRYPNGSYIHSSTLRALGIALPDIAYLNSLKFTREGYSDEFGLKISQAQQKYWNSLTDEQKFEILSKRCEGRDNWWNNLSYDEKLELAAGVDSENDLYRNYKKYVRSSKKEIQEGKLEQKLEKPTKKIKIGKSKLKDHEIFILWFQKNVEKFYSHLSEADKDVVHIKRVRKLAVRWQEMSPAERTELINKMREEREPLRYAMIDAWNHSPELIKELSKFLTAQQILKPVDLLYDTKEFSEFQSKVMTEFWESHRDLAEKFGENLKLSLEKVESSIKRGQFEDLKREIERDKKYRQKMLAHEKLVAEQRLNNVPAPKTAETDYRHKFKNAYSQYLNKDSILPATYIEEMANCILEDFDQNVIEKMTEVYQAGQELPKELAHIIEIGGTHKNYEKSSRLQRALEAAISNELYSKGFSPMIFSVDANTILGAYRQIMSGNVQKKQRPDPQRIQKLFNEYKKDLTDNEATNIAFRYFLIKDGKLDTPENDKIIIDYIKSYGRSALILFSDKSVFPNEVKIQFNEKFLKFMPEQIREFSIPAFSSAEDIKDEQAIQRIKRDIAKRFSFMPADFMTTYTEEVATTIRLFKHTDMPEKELYTIERYEENMCKKKKDPSDGSSLYIKIPKIMPPKESKIKMLAAEQALADELFRITGEEHAYENELENLFNIFEIFSITKSSEMEILDQDGNVKFKTKIRPNNNRVYAKYREYLNELKDRADDIFEGNYIKDPEELLCALNPIDGNEVRDNYIRNRIAAYFE